MKNQYAFTLIELMVTLAVFTILVVLAVPSMNSYTNSNRLSTETNSLVGALNIARSEAVKRRTNISVCKSADGATCGDNTVSWGNGWIVFVNTDNDSPAQVDGGEEILSIYGAINANDTLQVSGALANFVTYRSNGFGSALGDMIFCDPRGPGSARVVSINRTGRPSTTIGGGTCTPA